MYIECKKNRRVFAGMSVFIPIPKKGNAKECSNYLTIVLISHASKIMLKIFQARLQQYVNQELPDVQARFRKGRGTRDQIANIYWIIEKAKRVPKKHLFLLYWLCQSLWLCGSQQTVENFSRDEKIRLPYPPPEKSVYRSKSDMEQQTGSKLGKEHVKAVYFHPLYLSSLQSTSCEIQAGWSTRWNQDYWEKYQ